MTDDLLLLIFFAVLSLNIIALVLGLLLAAYNRRQALALSEARVVLEQFVIHQKKLHRDYKAQQNLIGDPLVWVSEQIMPEATVQVSQLQRVVPELNAAELVATDGARVVIAPLDAVTLRRLSKPKRQRLAQALAQPLLDGEPGVISVERSVLNGGDYFDLEAAQAGAHFSVRGWGEATKLYFHIVPARGVRD